MSLSRSIQTTSPPPHLTGHANALPVPATTYKLHKTHPFIKAQVEDMIRWCCCSMKPDNVTASRNFYCSLVWDTRSNSTSTTSAKDTRARVNKALPKSKNYKRPGSQSTVWWCHVEWTQLCGSTCLRNATIKVLRVLEIRARITNQKTGDDLWWLPTDFIEQW
jgi:hypothetical protein